MADCIGSLACILCLVPAVAGGQGAAHRLLAERTLTIDAAANDLSLVSAIAVSPKGIIAIAQPQDNAVRLFDAGGKSLRTLGRSGSGPGEFTGLFLIGWIGDTLWANDRSAGRLTYFSASGNLLRSLPWPRRLSYAPPDTGWSPKGFSMVPWGAFPDGDLLVKASFSSSAQRPSWAPASHGGFPLLKVSPTGEFRRLVGWPPPLDHRCIVEVPLPNGITGGSVDVPFCTVPVSDFSPDGAGMAVVTSGEAGGDAGSFRVAVMNATGDTVFSKAFASRPLRISRRVADSALDAEIRDAMRPEFVPVLREKVKVPQHYPPFRRVVIGRDHTIWVQVASERSEALWQVIDQSGKSIGLASFPLNFTVKVAERSAVWGIQADADGLQSVARYVIRN